MPNKRRARATPPPEEEIDYDTMLAELYVAREQEKEAKRIADSAKRALLAHVQELGEVPFIDADGNKRIAYYSDSEMKILDIDELLACVEEGLVSESLLELVAPRIMDGGALDDAIQAGRLKKEVIKRVLTLEHARPTIRFRTEGEGHAEAE